MGSSSSKTSSSSSSSSRSSRSRARRAIQSACFCSTLHGSDHTESEYKKKVTLRKTPSGVQTRTNTDDIKIECCAESNDVKSDELPCLSPSVQPDQWGQGSISDIDSRTNGQSIQVCSSRPSNSLNSFLSRVTSIPRNISFRLNRTASLGSSRSFPASSAHLRVLSDEEELNLHTRQGRGCVNGGLSTQMISSDHPVVRDTNSLRLVVDGDAHPPRTQSQMEPTETRQLWWTGARDHNEQNFRFGRTLSVGRLRDRVLRRSSLSDLVFSPPQQETDIRGSGQDSGRHIWHGDVVPPAPEVNDVSSSFSPVYASSSLPNSLVSTQDYQMETAQSTESRYNDLLEDRSNFLERRRRIHSQVRALRRLGSRFENLSGHTRSCIMSDEVRTGRCSCRIRSHDTSTNNDSNTGSSISRIVMLAEALFEVLDEIHQQSVVLSSQPSISSIGSVPAPNEVVESLPLKSYSKLQKQKIDEDTSQCYICLLDYEEGDSLRSLPCQHEFHRACVDKWLKEIHRVCPLCRGDVCRTNSLPLEM